MKNWEIRIRIFCLALAVALSAVSGFAGVSREIQQQYRKEYENRAMFLKIPIYAEKQMIYISGQNIRVDQGTGTPRFKVGDQLRITFIDFGGDEIKFRLGGIATPGVVDLGFKFDTGLQEGFPNRDVFDRALRATLTEGLKYTDIDNAKESFVEDQFQRAVKEIAGSASISREAVLKAIAPHVPAYQDAQRDIDGLRDRLQEISAQLSQTQTENRKLESQARAQEAELSKLKSSNTALQDKLENYNSQLAKLGDEVRDAKGSAQGYQKELANIQRSLNIRVDSGRDLAVQIADLGQAMRKMQKDNDTLTNQTVSLRSNLDAQQATNARLLGDNEELKAGNRKLQATLTELTSKEDSLAKRHLDLKNQKEKLDDLVQSIGAFRTGILEESTQDGMHYGKANVYVRNVLIGTLTWSIPANLSQNESKKGEASFSAESIDYVKVVPEERHILKSLGDRYKIRFDLTSTSDAMSVKPEENEPVRELAEREHSSWKWNVNNTGSKDARLTLTARLINRDSNEISFIRKEQLVTASSVVRQLRGYLQPIPLAAGAVIGFVLFGIVGIFRKPRRSGITNQPPAASSDPTVYIPKKQL